MAAFLLEIFVDILPSAGIFYEASWISEAVKWVAAFYMLVNTFGETDCGYGKIVLVGTTVYACSLVADRIWPLYEPIIGGRFPETSKAYSATISDTVPSPSTARTFSR